MGRMSIGGSFLAALVALGSAAQGEMIEARITTGIDPGQFFSAASGFVNGASTHTNTISFSDGLVQADFTLTAAAFGPGGVPASLNVANAAGVNTLGVSGNSQVETGESIKFTYDSVTYTIVGVPPAGLTVDPSTFTASVSSIALAAFEVGTDTFTYMGIGSGGATGDDTGVLTLSPTVITPGDMSTITGDSGSFRVLYLSNSVGYGLRPVPEPTTAALATLVTFGLIGCRRR
ncbi:hypothetical protein Pla108_17740 [Botrimarina colliarenosi]|uniref:PEP-CTERM protein-sorting domain-containing protein n=1 Tax=Botrimarina colliarenosi TaxID=2528001 RepID=A0A5C6AC54_9BACT|nr:hypothetical protein [Botrimarina colliarenosi]TWT97622.1 hypothetical protein Pla108_17740 [Botrimarina colliarenosi]